MNVNITKFSLSFTDYITEQVKCDNTAWQLKFNNSWNECDYWGGFTSFSIIAQVYEFDVVFLPKKTKFKFPLYVKSYNPEIFSSFTFNRAERPTINIKEFIVGNSFTLKQDINNTTLKFYLTSDVKLSKANVLNKYKLTFLGSIFSISIYSISSVNVIRYIKLPAKISLNAKALANEIRYIKLPAKISLNAKALANEIRYINLIANFNPTIQTKPYENRYINSLANIPLYGSVYIMPNCNSTIWIRKFEAWGDCDTWSVYIMPNCSFTFWSRKFEAWGDCDTWMPKCNSTIWIRKFEAWGDCDTWA